MQDLFRRFAQHTSWPSARRGPSRAPRRDRRLGGAGADRGFSTTWQLVINTGTTIVTFLIVFLIQNTQNRESRRSSSSSTS